MLPGMREFIRRHWGAIVLALLWAFALSAVIFGGAGHSPSALNPDR